VAVAVSVAGCDGLCKLAFPTGPGLSAIARKLSSGSLAKKARRLELIIHLTRSKGGCRLCSKPAGGECSEARRHCLERLNGRSIDSSREARWMYDR